MFSCYTFPVGAQPDNKSWSGFQMVSEQGVKDNYLLLFRELHNAEPVKKITLKFLSGKTVRLINLRTNTIEIKKAGGKGELNFAIKTPADFLFLKYEVMH